MWLSSTTQSDRPVEKLNAWGSSDENSYSDSNRFPSSGKSQYRRYSALMYASVVAVSLGAMLAIINLQPVAYLVLKGKDTNPLLPEITQFTADYSPNLIIAISQITDKPESQVYNIYNAVERSNQTITIPRVYQNRFGSYKLTSFNKTSYFALLTLNHFVTDKNQFDEAVIPSPDDGINNSLLEILQSLSE